MAFYWIYYQHNRKVSIPNDLMFYRCSTVLISRKQIVENSINRSFIICTPHIAVMAQYRIIGVVNSRRIKKDFRISVINYTYN